MTIHVGQFSGVLDRVYRAALDATLWPAALQEISDLMQSGVSGLVVMDKRRGAFPLAASDGRTPTPALDDYTRHYGYIDDLRSYARGRPVGTITESAALPKSLLKRSECYNDFYLRWNLQHFVGSYLLNDNAYEASLVVYRGDSQRGAYTSEQLAVMEMIVPHLMRAVQIWARLRETTAERDATCGVLDHLSQGVVLLDRAGAILLMNRTASEIIRRSDGLTAGAQGLSARNPETAKALRKAIAGVTGTGRIESSPMHVSVERPGGQAAYRLFTSPLVSDAHPGLPPLAVAVVFIHDPSSDQSLSHEHLRRRYGLTGAEMDLAKALVEGKTVRQFADERAIADATARTHLKHLLGKTNTHRQTELVMLLLRMSGGAGRG